MNRLLSALVLLFVSWGAFAAPARVAVTGPDGLPIPGATVRVGEAQFITGPAGDVTVDAAAGSRVIVELDGFATAETTLAAQTNVSLSLAGMSDEITVSGVQSRVPLAELSSSVTMIEREEIDEQLRTSANLADALGKMVPGLAPGSGSASIYGQTIRGRGMQILVDGVPLTTLRNGARDLVALDPSIVERVEVLRGTTALYGDGATGGLINIITRQPEPGETRFTTDLTFTSSLSHPEDSSGRSWCSRRAAAAENSTGAWTSPRSAPARSSTRMAIAFRRIRTDRAAWRRATRSRSSRKPASR